MCSSDEVTFSETRGKNDFGATCLEKNDEKTRRITDYEGLKIEPRSTLCVVK